MFRPISWQRTVCAGLLPLVFSAALLVVAVPSQADLLPYGQSFEGMVQSDPGALSGDGWLVYGNVFNPSMTYLYGYGPFPAPNGGPPAFCVLASGQGGATQGSLQLSVFSDYENADHANGNWIESNVFQERTVGAVDVGDTWYFSFDAKLGNISGSSSAVAFIKTLAPPTYALTNFITVNLTSIPTTWARYAVSLNIDATLVGQIFQFGFANTATHYEPSGIYVDNVELSETPPLSVPFPGGSDGQLRLSARSNPARGRDGQVLALTVPRHGRVTVAVYDVAGNRVATLEDRELDAGGHQVTWHGDDVRGRAVAAGLYLVEVTSGSQRAVAKLSRLR